MTAALALQILGALIGDFPEILAEAEALIAAIKGQAVPAVAPITPTIVSEDAALLSALAKPVT